MSGFKESAKNFFDAAAEETVRLGDTATLYVKLQNCRIHRDSEYKTLGKLTYQKLTAACDNTAEINASIAKITEFNAKEAEILAEIEKKK